MWYRLPAFAVSTLFGTLALATGGRAAGAQGAGRAIPQWTVAERPQFDSQATAADGGVALLGAMGATLLRDGSVAVADNAGTSVKWFAGDGRLLRSFGREGDGPGEFRLLNLIGTCGTDSLFVFDGANQRLTTLTLDGKLVTTRVFSTDSSESGAPSQIACGRARAFGVLGWPRGAIPPGDVAYRTTVGVRIHPIDTRQVIDAGTAASSERQRFGNSAGPRPLGKRTSIALGSDRMYVGTGDSALIRVVGLDGRDLPAIRLPFFRIPIRRPHISAYIEGLVARNTRVAPERIRLEYARLQYPEYFPMHGALLVDSDDNLWVEEYRWPGDEVSRWSVFSKSGVAVATITLPPRFRLSEAGRHYVLGTWEDPDDVQHVRMYRISRL